MFTILDRHIGRSILIGTFLVLGIFSALFVFIVLVDVLPDHGKGNFGTYQLLRYVLLSQPRKLYEIFPVTVLIGTLLGLSTLALNSELIAMRAAGVSKGRIAGAAMKTGLVLVIGAVLVGEYLVPVAETRAQTGRARALAASFQQGTTGLWVREGETFVNIGEVLPDLSLLRVSIYDLTPDFQMREHTYAAQAVYDGERWQLGQVRSSSIKRDRVDTHAKAGVGWETTLTPDVVAVFTTRAEALSIAQLYAYIRHLRSNNQDVGRFTLTFWQKFLMPIATAVMILLAVPFVFRPVRSGGLAQRAFTGVVLGLAFVVVSRSLGYMALLYGVPPFVAAVAPLIMFFAIAVALSRRLA